MDKKHLYDTMVTECTKLLIAEGVASEDGFIKLFDEELKKKLDAGNLVVYNLVLF